MDVFRYSIKPEFFSQISEDHKRALFYLGHIQNEINFFRNTLISSAMKLDRTELGVIRSGAITAFSCILRIYVLKVVSAREYIDRALSSKSLISLGQSLDDEGKAALKALRRYFGSKNILQTIRNKFSAHYDFDQNIHDSDAHNWETLSIIFGPNRGNSLYWMSEMGIINQMRSICGGVTETEALIKIASEANENADQIMIFSERFIMKILESNNLLQAEKGEREDSLIKPPGLSEIYLPYFLDFRS